MRSLTPGILATATLTALTLLAPAAFGAEPNDKTQLIGKVHVDLKNLNLANAADARTLLERLKQAAYDACGGDPKLNNTYKTRPEQTVRVYEECREDAVKRAIDQIGAPLLARMYAEDERHATADECGNKDRVLARASVQSGA